MSEMYILKSGGKRTPPCGTSVMNWYCEYVESQKVV